MIQKIGLLNQSCKPYSTCWMLILLATLVGCSGSERRFELKGEITLDGAPLENATLILTPKGKGPAVAAIVVDGKFQVLENFGPTLDDYDVRINPLDGNDDPACFVANARAGKKKQLIPREYQSDGNLTVSIKGSPGETFKLDLKSSAQLSRQ
jgi:hypothetical protein